jgi:hypothetical protein
MGLCYVTDKREIARRLAIAMNSSEVNLVGSNTNLLSLLACAVTSRRNAQYLGEHLVTRHLSLPVACAVAANRSRPRAPLPS